MYVNWIFIFEKPFEFTWTTTGYVPALCEPVIHVIWVLVADCTTQGLEPIETLTPPYKYLLVTLFIKMENYFTCWASKNSSSNGQRLVR